MQNLPLNTSQSLMPGPDFLSRASSLLAAEVSRMQLAQLPAVPSPNFPSLPDAGASSDPINTLLASPQIDELRRRGTEFLDTLLGSLSQSKGGAAASPHDHVPLIHGAAPVAPGARARATFRVANEEAASLDVSLYCSNFVADSGYELPSLLFSVTPRSASIPAGGEASFEVELAVPAQTPRGDYSGLVQAAGCKYVKAVLLFSVL